eukprot:gene12730-14035_t
MEAKEITRGLATASSLSTIRRLPQPSKRICKSLFGPVNHEEVSSQLDLELEKDLEEKSQEWCFNFTEGTPILGGSLIWEEIKEKEKPEKPTEKPQAIINEDRRVPELHPESSCERDDVFVSPTSVESSKTTSTTKSISPATPAHKSTVESTEKMVEKKRKRPCKTITDFMKQKKRRRVSYSSMEKNSSQHDMNSHCVKDDLVLKSSAKRVKITEG